MAITIYYDEDCGTCKRIVGLIKSFFSIPHLQVLPGQKDPKILEKMEQQNSWVVKDHQGQDHFKFDAVLLVLGNSRYFFPLRYALSIPGIPWVGTRIYDFVALRRNRNCAAPATKRGH